MSERGTIYDIGYKRYVGTRRSVATRWLVIMRNQLSMGWKKWWRYKLALFFAVVTTFIAGGFMYVAANQFVRGFGARAHDVMVTMSDGVLPLSIPFYLRCAFILSLTLGSTIVANDTQSGAFTFYYVRSIRPTDYVLGKLAGLGMLVATVVLVPPFLLACFRLGMCDSMADLVAHLHILPKVLLVGSLSTLAYTALPLAISSLVASRRYALALWASYYLIIGNMAFGLSWVTSPSIAALDLPTALQTITFHLFDLDVLSRMSRLTYGAAVIGVLLQVVAAIAILWYQVSRDQKSGVGGSS